MTSLAIAGLTTWSVALVDGYVVWDLTHREDFHSRERELDVSSALFVTAKLSIEFCELP